MERTGFDPDSLGAAIYPLLNSVVVPRPIAWVSTLSASGVRNLAPHSYFTVSSVRPPVVQFTSIGHKDSLRNVRATGEFVVNVVNRELAEIANATSTDFPPDVSEFEWAGVEAEESLRVAPPRVARSPVAIECAFEAEHSFGDSVVVFGRVLHVAVQSRVLSEQGRVDLRLLDPVSRLGGNDWAEVGAVFSLRRVPFTEVQQ